MSHTSSNTADTGRQKAPRIAPPGEGSTAVGPGGNAPHHARKAAAPGETRRIEGAGPGRTAGTADDLGTSGSRGAMGARDEQNDPTRPRDGRGPDSPG